MIKFKYAEEGLERYSPAVTLYRSQSAFFAVKSSALVTSFIQSLMPYYNTAGKIDPAFADIKRKELLLILLQKQPELAGLLFDFGVPGKIDLETFMNRNFRFNVAIQRFAYLTGRSLTSFKKEFEKTFHDTPRRWLLQKRLREAHFLIEKEGRKPSDVYLEVGFEDLSHFSFAFKKLFGYAPTHLSAAKRENHHSPSTK